MVQLNSRLSDVLFGHPVRERPGGRFKNLQGNRYRPPAEVVLFDSGGRAAGRRRGRTIADDQLLQMAKQRVRTCRLA
jgi:hypothetical protein